MGRNDSLGGDFPSGREKQNAAEGSSQPHKPQTPCSKNVLSREACQWFFGLEAQAAAHLPTTTRGGLPVEAAKAKRRGSLRWRGKQSDSRHLAENLIE
jgi:hypothetical protein